MRLIDVSLSFSFWTAGAVPSSLYFRHTKLIMLTRESKKTCKQQRICVSGSSSLKPKMARAREVAECAISDRHEFQIGLA